METVEIRKKERSAQNTGEFPLAPVLSPWMGSVMDNSELIDSLTEKHGSPINIHHLNSFDGNIQNYRAVFDEFGIRGQIYFARKANKSGSLVKRALTKGIGVDTASFKELRQGIELGGDTESLVLTAAIKTEPMIRLAVVNDIPIIVDNEDELKMVEKVAGKLDRIAPIGLRLSGFMFGGKELYSRFGFNIKRDGGWLKRWFNEHRFDHLHLQGLHFHLDSYSVAQRAEAIIQCLRFKKYLGTGGESIDFLDIGGGILMNYLKDGTQWDEFLNALKKSVTGDSDPITFNNDGLGFEKCQVSGGIIGALKTYPYFNRVNSSNFLRAVLRSANTDGDGTVAEAIISNDIQLRIEPGRSLLDQVGLTIAKVAHRKKDSRGNWLVGLEMNMSQLKSSSRDYLVDPVVIYKKPLAANEKYTIFFTGAYCLEQDVILKRKFEFPALPEIGDFVAFINTGGYMMHFYETEAHLFDLSKNLYTTAGDKVDLDSIYLDHTKKG